MNTVLSQEDLEQLVSLLKKLKPGFMPQEVFFEIARVSVVSTYVIVPLMMVEGRLKVLLTRRNSQDKTYPNMLHPPGKIILATDTDLHHTYSRLIKTELEGIKIISEVSFVEIFFEEISRGKELTIVNWVEIGTEVDSKDLYDPFDLPIDTIASDVKRIQSAARHFLKISEFN